MMNIMHFKKKFRKLKQGENQVRESLGNEQSILNMPHEVVALSSLIKKENHNVTLTEFFLQAQTASSTI